MFCDLVGSTALSEQLDPEDMNDIILAYREIVAKAVAPFDGFVARYVGDGVLIYLAYPRAHGDDPVRALHAALEIISRVRPLSTTPGMEHAGGAQVRIGVHTGLVVVGELSRGSVREEAGVVGEAPNLAARLVSLAAPNAVQISDVTYALTKGHFDCVDLGPQQLKGLSRSVHVYEVARARSPDTGIDFADRMNATALAGRAQELALLGERWSQVVAGRGCVVAIIGEPGMGKTRLARAFSDSLLGTDHLQRVLQCSPYFSNTALYPIVDHLKRWLDRMGGDKLRALADAVAATGMPQLEVVPIIASLLELPLAAPYQPPQSAGKRRRDLTIAFLLDWLAREASLHPILIVVEDLHWADASTMELLRQLYDRIDTRRILLLVAFRPELQTSWLGDPRVMRLPLDRLMTAQVHEMIQNVAGERTIPESVRNRLAEKCDGVPLFVEELTKAFLESKAPAATDDAVGVPATSVDFEIPISLHATLMARLDSMNTAKLIAQRAAVLGREFSYELIAAIAAVPPAELRLALAQLVEAELLFQRGAPPQASYIFKHSMIQETAYRSLLRVKRQQYHHQVAQILVARFPQISQSQPELVAHHFSAAHAPVDAAAYWRLAGQNSLARSANVEARAHIEKGLAELEVLPGSAAKFKEEVALLIAFGSVLTALKGSAAPEVEQTYARARQVCQELNDVAQLFPVMRGLQSFYVVRGPLRTALEIVDELCEMAQRKGDSLERVEAHRRKGWCLFCMGHMDLGREYLERAMLQYDRSQSARHIMQYGSDPGVIGLANLAWLEWFAGRAGKAMHYSNESIELARSLSYGLGMAYALGMSAALFQSLGDAARTATLATETIDLATKHGFPYWVAWETALLGWSRAIAGDVDAGISLIDSGIMRYRATGAELFRPYMLGLLAEVKLRARRYDEALAHCDDALASAERTGAHFFDAEVHRLEGKCILKRDADAGGAAHCYERVMSISRGQGAQTLELRGAMHLAMLQRSQGDGSEGLRLLSDAVSRFDGDQSMPEGRAGNRLLRRWQRHGTLAVTVELDGAIKSTR